MIRHPRLLVLPLLLSGCVSTVTTVAKAPFKVAGKAIDWTTTSQSEADRNYGRKMRKQEERAGRAHRELVKQCRKHPGGPDCASLTAPSNRPGTIPAR